MNADEQIAATFFRKRPDAAARLLETMDIRQAAELVEALPATVAATVISRMLPTSSARCAEQLSADAIVALLKQLPVLTGAALLRHLPRLAREDALGKVGATRATALKLLLRYPANAVGAWMNPSVLTLSSDLSTAEAAELLEQTDHAEPIVFVIDRDRRPVGCVRSLTLLRQNQHGNLRSIAENVETIWARETIQSAQRKDCWQWQSEAPVVNRQGEFVGSITLSDLTKGERNTSRNPSTDASAEQFGELAELAWHGIDGVWKGLQEVLQPRIGGTGRSKQ